ncbi:MAG: chloride channel protein [Desulfovibrio sp.]|nr:chloride channel protein [Desulfovibrio sp.]
MLFRSSCPLSPHKPPWLHAAGFWRFIPQALATGLAAGTVIGLFRLACAETNDRIVRYAHIRLFDDTLPIALLLAGAIGGASLATVLLNLGAVATDQSATILVLSMAGLFSATVRAPLTAAALLVEITGSLGNAPAIFFTACIATMTANCLHSPPVFHSLKLRLRNALHHGRTSALK